MYIIGPHTPDAPFSIIIAEHQRRSIKRFNPPVKTVWFTIRPCDHLRFVASYSRYQYSVAPVVTFRF